MYSIKFFYFYIVVSMYDISLKFYVYVYMYDMYHMIYTSFLSTPSRCPQLFSLPPPPPPNSKPTCTHFPPFPPLGGPNLSLPTRGGSKKEKGSGDPKRHLKTPYKKGRKKERKKEKKRKEKKRKKRGWKQQMVE